MEAIVLIAFVMLAIGAFAYNQRLIADRRDRATAVAAELGLTVKGTDELSGSFEGVPVVQYSKDHGGSSNTQWWTYTRCTLLEPLPSGMAVTNQGFFGHIADAVGSKDIQLGNRLDPKLRIKGDDEGDVRELLTDVDVEHCLHAVVGSSGKIDLRGQELEIRIRGHHLESARPRIQMAVQLARALAHARQKHWMAVAAVHDLTLSEDGTRLTGEIRARYRDGETRIEATVEPPLPDGTRVTHADRGAGSIELGDPILDPMVSVATSDPTALAARICNDAVRGPLLEVVHGFPGSTVGETHIQLVMGWPGRRFEDAIGAIRELADALARQDG